MADFFYNEGVPWRIPALNSEQLQFLTSGLVRSVYKKDQYLTVDDSLLDCIWIIEKGHVITEMLDYDGNTKNVLYLYEGNFLNETSALLRKEPNLTQYKFLTASILYKLRAGVLLERLSKHRECLDIFLRSQAAKNNILMTQIKMLSMASSVNRVKRILYWFYRSYSEESQEDGYRYKVKKNMGNLKLTHQMIADLAGVTRVCVSNVFIRLYEDRILSKSGEYYYLRDLKDLDSGLNS